MFDESLRRRFEPALDRIAAGLERRSIGPGAVTLTGLGLGLGAALAAASAQWPVALVLWIASRLADGLDGALARRVGPSPRGGFWDIVADFTVYGAFVAGVAVSRPEARLAAVVLLWTYYVSGASFLAWSSLRSGTGDPAPAASSDLALDDNRSLAFVGGLAEGAETITAYVVVCLIPAQAEPVLWVFAALVAVTAGQRVWFASRTLEGGTVI